MKSRSHEIGTLNCRIALKFDRHIGSNAAEVPVKFQSDRTILNINLAASRLHEILRKDVFSDIETGPSVLSTDLSWDKHILKTCQNPVRPRLRRIFPKGLLLKGYKPYIQSKLEYG